jgi:hypothetical protein
MNSRFDLSSQELSILITSMQCMTKHEEAHSGPPNTVSCLYNKLTSRHEFLLKLHHDYIYDI